MRRFPVLVLLALGVLALSGSARAAGTNAEFQSAVEAIENGAYGEAIDRLELFADRGFVHPDASFNRGVAYLGRARSPQRQPGDLGRAAAALAETLELRPDDREAETALESVRSEIGRARARSGGAPLVARPRLARALVGLASESAWGVVALLGSVALAWGLLLRLIVRKPSAAVPGALSIGIGVLLLAIGGTLCAGARHFRRHSTRAVVVVAEARLLDETGRPLPVSPANETNVAPEGAEIYVLERRGGLTRIEWGSAQAWVVAGQVRELASLGR